MQCPDCGYISFRQEKACGSCGFNFKKVTTASLFRNDSFTVFRKEQESSDVSPLQAGEDIAVMEHPEESRKKPESGEFLLDLSDAEQDHSKDNLKSEAVEFTPMEFSTDSYINLEEMEVEGLGLGLEPLEDEASTPETSKIEIEEAPSEISEEPNAMEDITLKINGLDEILSIEDSGLESSEKELEIIPSSAQNLEQDTPMAPILDLGNTELSLDLGEDLESESPSPPTTQPESKIDELEIQLEIDDSDGPLVTSSVEIPEIEIEDLGLELEDSEDSEDSPPDQEKP
jgi:hypothetical protein